MDPVLAAFVGAAANMVWFGGILYALTRPSRGNTTKVWTVLFLPVSFNLLVLALKAALTIEQRVAGLVATLLLAAIYIVLVMRGVLPMRRGSAAADVS